MRTKLTLSALLGVMLLSAAPLSVTPTFAQSPSQATPSDEQTATIVEAAKDFITSLSEEQQAAVQFEFTDSEQRARWSNFPLGIFERAGVRWGDLTEKSRAALTTLLGTVLSPYGLTMVQQQMAADDVLANEDSGAAPDPTTGGGSVNAGAPPADAGPPARGGGLGGGLIFGSDYYYVSLLGEPSETDPWMLQFGGHHLAINATVVGGDVTITPSLTGGQPVKFTLNGEPVYIVEDEVEQAATIMESLTDHQRTTAILGTSKIDLVLGPGKDGLTLQPEGLAGAQMTDDQKAQFLQLISSRLMILNEDDVAPKLAAIEANLDETCLAWFGSADNAQGSSWRVTGPTILLEFSPQDIGGDPTDYVHNMYRDPTNDYGAAWAALD